ncbi:class I SAM-dependent methyltransferase [Hydrogenophaga sp. OTU3427]|uniref:class I SAM-dependent methyltransferase n=1 Tax=Hydrogenophaga sp. OTU3427 TaxID=3043856 RepID=UPI00313BE73B
MLAWEQAEFDAALADVFGFHAVQLGLPEMDTLAGNRIPHRWLGLPDAEWPLVCPWPVDVDDDASEPRPMPALPRWAFVTHAAALPFPAASLDLVVLPHTLELSADPHTVLREVERVLVPEGRLVISGLNPASLWGLRQARAHLLARLGLSALGASELYLPAAGEFIGHWRLRDWLRLLSFEVESCHFGAYRPAVRTEKWLQRWAWMEAVGARWWPILGAVYFITAVKRVRGMHVLGPAWKPRRATAAAPVTAARQQPLHHRTLD